MSVFSAPMQQKIQHYLGRYETKRSAILPILHSLQDENGWIKDEYVEGLEKEFNLPKVHVREVLTFYSMYRQKPVKKFQVLFCNNLVCHMMGADGVMAKIQGHIDKYQKAKGADVPFSLEGVPCLGVCDGAPAMLVNKERHLRVTLEN